MSVTRSFKAMWIWMRLIGVELDETRKGSPLRRRLSWVVGLIWFAFDLSSHLATFVFLKRNLNEESGNDLTNKVASIFLFLLLACRIEFMQRALTGRCSTDWRAWPSPSTPSRCTRRCC